MHRFSLGSLWEVVTIPFVVMVIWSLVVFVIGVIGSVPDLSMEAAGSGLVGLILGFISSLLLVIMSLIVGFNAARNKLTGLKSYLICGALFGFLASLFAGILDFILAVIGWLSGQPAASGLQGISLRVILSLIGMQVNPVWNLGLVLGNAILLMAVGVLGGAILATIAGALTERLS
ncbi:MAG: hypothetical protein J7L23_04985 [Candidatus Diapherotrites archaeon]|nr:hypothetical protein [Candidatus Diapherotrites archaeon]